jgi:protein tyrosine phosphatase (PTP) superfamily phosphohydrolase (DUF442 family)
MISLKKRFFSLLILITLCLISIIPEVFAEEKKAPAIVRFFEKVGQKLKKTVVPALENFHCVDDKHGIYRSGQLSKDSLRLHIDKHGIKTIINLRGQDESSSDWQQENAIAKEKGVNLVCIGTSARKYISIDSFEKLLNVFDSSSKPFLIHCRAGIDRTGEACAIYLINKYIKLHMDPEEKRKILRQSLDQLSIRYGHLRTLYPKKKKFVRKFCESYLKIIEHLEQGTKNLNKIKAFSGEAMFFNYALFTAQRRFEMQSS